MPLQALQRLLQPLAGGRRSSRVIQICACNNLPKFQQYAGASVGIAPGDQVRFDNSSDNRPVPVRYNEFIDTMPAREDAWLAFVHNDFQFHEDPARILATAPRDRIYGVVGANLVPAPGNGQAGKAYRMVGCVQCSPKLIASGWCGEPIREMTPAKTLDCCCIIVHSSLVQRYRLRFNPRYEWHFYSEEFSLRAFRDHGIETWVLPLRSGHYGLGATNAAFFECRLALYAEYPDTFVSTCFNPLHHLQPKS
jgi:hypothetical protein